ncbi:hypothetical protein A1Q2_06992 [Trichosporon asahii var. asahii CBS 8904]|uniref:Uncharacterized protein n=1 Tax=Trichosporon asahii var. asahii (strain CBS 8904) TaxID=1220162 RepID=K1VD95_TRIAC|nr:hypothetical protein A1Q2_06992 [Trichosporon asahii var. asahii CBS 8904]
MTPSIQDHDPKHQTSDVPQTLSGSESCFDGGLNQPEQTTPPSPPPYSLFTKKQRWLILGLGTISVSTTHLNLNLHLHPSHTKFTTSSRLSTFSGFASNIYFPAIPTIASSLNTTVENINLTVTSYMIFQAITPTFWGAVQPLLPDSDLAMPAELGIGEHDCYRFRHGRRRDDARGAWRRHGHLPDGSPTAARYWASARRCIRPDAWVARHILVPRHLRGRVLDRSGPVPPRDAAESRRRWIDPPSTHLAGTVRQGTRAAAPRADNGVQGAQARHYRSHPNPLLPRGVRDAPLPVSALWHVADDDHGASLVVRKGIRPERLGEWAHVPRQWVRVHARHADDGQDPEPRLPPRQGRVYGRPGRLPDRARKAAYRLDLVAAAVVWRAAVWLDAGPAAAYCRAHCGVIRARVGGHVGAVCNFDVSRRYLPAAELVGDSGAEPRPLPRWRGRDGRS